MNIVLVSPKPAIFEPSKVIPLGIAYLSAVLERDGHNVSVLDLNVEEDDLERKARDADLVGVSCVTPSVKAGWRLCERVKGVNPNAVTVLGGPHATAIPEESLGNPHVDIVVRGEGEQTIVDLCSRIEKREALDQVRGISYKNNDHVKHNVARRPIEDLDSLPFPAYHLLNLDRYTGSHAVFSTFFERKQRVGLILTSRGCPYDCSFCYKATFGRAYKSRSAGNVVEEMKFLSDKYDIQSIGITDDAFTLNKKRAMDICRGILDERIDIRWETSGGIRADTASADLLDIMRKAGCFRVWFGIESGSQRVLDDVINKRMTLEQGEDAVKAAKKLGIKAGAFFVLGHPGETIEDMRKTIDFAVKLDPDYCQFTLATPYPGTRLYELVKDRLLVTDWDLFGHFEGNAYFEHGEITEAVLKRMYKHAYRKFFLRPSFIIRMILDPHLYPNLSSLLKVRRFIC